MTEKCFDIGTIQAFLDGELLSEKSESVARHISFCNSCAGLLAEAEEESAIAFSALEQEFNTLVPTQRLWTKINDSIGREKKSFWESVFAFALQPSTAAFAGLLFVAALFVALLSMKTDEPKNYVNLNNENKQSITFTASPIQEPTSVTAPQKLSVRNNVENAKFNQAKNDYRVTKTNFVKNEIKKSNVKRDPRKTTDEQLRTTDKPLSGEESYIKTIATLTESVKNRKDEVLNPSARFALERDLAVTDDAIKKMRLEVKQNPNNEAAKQILRASYQNKIDLLNSVADKNELMASIK